MPSRKYLRGKGPRSKFTFWRTFSCMTVFPRASRGGRQPGGDGCTWSPRGRCSASLANSGWRRCVSRRAGRHHHLLLLLLLLLPYCWLVLFSAAAPASFLLVVVFFFPYISTMRSENPPTSTCREMRYLFGVAVDHAYRYVRQ